MTYITCHYLPYLQLMYPISIIIPAHNEEAYIQRCLESIQKSKSPSLREVIVVVNASTDRTAEIAESFEGVRVVREDRKGTSFARQRGFEASSCDLLAYIDADSFVTPDWFLRIDRHFRFHPNTACLTGPCVYSDLPRRWYILYLLYIWVLTIPASWITGLTCLGGNMVIRRTALKDAGGFDTSLTFFGDDTNTAKRLKPFGKVHFDPFFKNYTSARRLREEGVFKTAFLYVLNFLAQVMTGKSVVKQAKDIR